MHRLRIFLPGLALVMILTTLSSARALQQDKPEQNSPAPRDPAIFQESPATPPEVPAAQSEIPAAQPEVPTTTDLVELRLADLLQDSLESPSHRYPKDSREAWLVWRELTRFYENRGHHPAWVNARGAFPMANRLLTTVNKAAGQGLDARHYPVDDLQAQLAAAKDESTARWVELDIELTHLYFTYARHLAVGRLNPTELKTQWHHRSRKVDFAQTLEDALAFNQVEKSLEGMVPPGDQYQQLVWTLARLREMSWPLVHGSFIAGKGDRDAGLALVRDFLRAVGDLPAGPDSQPEVMDAQLAEAVQAFQTRHGLKPDGVVGPQTLRQMQVAAKDRLQTVLINMERRRWMGDAIPDRAIVVNIPEYKLRVFEGGEVQFSMKAITGTDSTQTPAFADKITYLELNPVWHLPSSIAGNEILPKILADSSYLASADMSVHDSTGARVDPDSVDWASISPGNLGYRLRQAPGAKNPLGSIKFMFPNRHSVYLHDTPNGRAFNSWTRALSHGCVRIEHPLTLGAYLLQDSPGWTGLAFADSVRGGRRQWIDLPQPMPIYILYFTAFVEEGKMAFRPDVYERDKAVAAALTEYVSPFQRVRGFVADLNSPTN